MTERQDVYKTLEAPSEGFFKSKGSKFFAYAYPIIDESEVGGFVRKLKDDHFKARHWCFAFRLGQDDNRWRANDDGEPSGTAGRPILGQVDAFGLRDVLIVVVRYFGGTKLGVPGLIEAYREAARDALDQAPIVEKIRTRKISIVTDYGRMPHLLGVVKASTWTIEKQIMEEELTLILGHALSTFDNAYLNLWLALEKVYLGEEDLNRSPAGYRINFLD